MKKVCTLILSFGFLYSEAQTLVATGKDTLFYAGANITATYISPEEKEWPNLFVKGFDIKEGRLHLYTRLFLPGLIRMDQKPFPKDYTLIPIVATVSSDLNLQNIKTEHYNILLSDLSPNYASGYEVSNGEMVALPGQENMSEMSLTKSPKLVGSNTMDAPLSGLMEKFPIAFEELKPQNHKKEEKFYTSIGHAYRFHYNTWSNKPFDKRTSTYPSIVKEEKSFTTDSKKISETNKVFALNFVAENQSKKQWFTVYSENDKKVKRSDFRCYHFCLYNEKGELLNDHKITYEYLKGPSLVQYVPDIEKEGDGVYAVVMNSNPINGLEKLKDPNKDKYHTLIFSTEGKLLYTHERDMGGKEGYRPMYAFKKGEDVMFLEAFNTGITSLRLAKINPSGVSVSETTLSTFIGSLEAKLYGKTGMKNFFSPIDLKRKGDKLYLIGEQMMEDADVGTLTNTTTYLGLHVVELDVKNGTVDRLFSFERKDNSPHAKIKIDTLIEQEGNFFLLSHLVRRQRTNADNMVMNMYTNNQFTEASFMQNELTAPIVYGVRLSDSKAITFVPQDTEYTNLYPKGSYRYFDGSLYFVGYHPKPVGMAVFHFLKVKL